MESLSIVNLVLAAGPVAKSVLLILLVFSVVSWAIIIFKWRQLRCFRRASEGFIESFWTSRTLSEVFKGLKDQPQAPVAEVFRMGYQELVRIRRSTPRPKAPEELSLWIESVVTRLERALDKAVSLELARLEEGLPFLATTGNATPFIGLFGTVWGIMGAFHNIGAVGSASLATVAPGIAEALIATAFGLAAAIPAVVAFNLFMSQVGRFETDIRAFVRDFLNLVERDLLQEGIGEE
ncbi:protein TolQ [Thermosulfuriphilus sp.]